MNIIFKAYSIIWILILLLYSFNWTEFSTPLDSELLVFLLITIFISLYLGFVRKPKLKIKRIEQYNPKYKYITIFIVIGFIVNFIYSGYIPFFGIISGKNQYIEFPGIPFIYSFFVTFAFFYFFYLSFCYISLSKDKRCLIYMILILICFLLIFSRSLLIFSIFGYFFMKYVCSNKKNKNKIIVIAIFLVIIGSYAFGVLGNLRVGSSWNDSSHIEMLGMFTYYPKWLPKQFMWVYLYLITPLSNLNYNVLLNNQDSDVTRLIVSYIPEFVSKRFFPNFIITSQNETLLIKSYFNAQTGYVESYYAFGTLGLYLTFSLLIIYYKIISYFVRKNNVTNPVYIITLFIFLILMFFYNSFYYMLSSMLLVWTIIYILFFTKRKQKEEDKLKE